MNQIYHYATHDEIKDSVIDRLTSNPTVAEIMGIEIHKITSLPKLFSLILGNVAKGNPAIANTVEMIFTSHPNILAGSVRDINETARRNFEPGGVAATLLFSRGVHAILAHRVAHQIWLEGDQNLSLSIKYTLGTALTTDIHPAAQIGSGVWLDHGLGFVVGETAVIEDDVSIWHNVTLGSTLNDNGSTRHPRIERGAILGAGATILGGITVGENSSVAAGAIVLDNVPPSTVIAGTKANIKGKARISFT